MCSRREDVAWSEGNAEGSPIFAFFTKSFSRIRVCACEGDIPCRRDKVTIGRPVAIWFPIATGGASALVTLVEHISHKVGMFYVVNVLSRYGVPCYGTGLLVVSVLVPCGNRMDQLLVSGPVPICLGFAYEAFRVVEDRGVATVSVAYCYRAGVSVRDRVAVYLAAATSSDTWLSSLDEWVLSPASTRGLIRVAFRGPPQSPPSIVLYHNPMFDMDHFRVLADDFVPIGLLDDVAQPSAAILSGHIEPSLAAGGQSRPPSPPRVDGPHSQFSQLLPHLSSDQVCEFLAATKDPTPLRQRDIHFSEPCYLPAWEVRPKSPPMSSFYQAEPVPLSRERSYSLEHPHSLTPTHHVSSRSDFLAEWTTMKMELHDLRRQLDSRKAVDIPLPSFQYLRVPPQLELHVFQRYSRVGDPYVHLKDFVYEVAPHKYDRHLMAYLFRKSLDGPALEWFYSLPPEEAEDFQIVQEWFLQQF
ncbi:hypothetical protein Taro_030487 [Colocasia esculenta]|uniref:Retrotransposon gag domain-containing protein n=1 Tax=Colocasia esculenta TaxID=4460 RepID=A0A843W3G8_COLES|nr:hypothetical protein [Colocasia esculenta]